MWWEGGALGEIKSITGLGFTALAVKGMQATAKLGIQPVPQKGGLWVSLTFIPPCSYYLTFSVAFGHSSSAKSLDSCMDVATLAVAILLKPGSRDFYASTFALVHPPHHYRRKEMWG